VEKRFLLQKAFDNRVTRPYNPAPRRRRVLRNTATGGVIRLKGSVRPFLFRRCDLTLLFTGKGNEGGVRVVLAMANDFELSWFSF
jgi:hypothetical protein